MFELYFWDYAPHDTSTVSLTTVTNTGELPSVDPGGAHAALGLGHRHTTVTANKRTQPRCPKHMRWPDLCIVHVVVVERRPGSSPSPRPFARPPHVASGACVERLCAPHPPALTPSP